jgi:hypothetical protein
MAMVRPAAVVDVEAGEVVVVPDAVDDDVVAGVVAPGVGAEPEHAASAMAVPATAATMVRRRIPLSSLFAADECRRIRTGVTDAAIVGKVRSATMCGCPTG